MNSKKAIATLEFILCNVPQPDGGLCKKALEGPVRLGAHGLESADGVREYYEDPDCALMNYALEHYDTWRARYPSQADALRTPGIFGENFATRGITEHAICIGDVLRAGTALLRVSWGRVACATMAARLNDEQAPEIMHRESRNGWFYRVLEEGDVRRGDHLILADRPHGAWPLTRLQDVVFGGNGTPAELDELAGIDTLAAPWRAIVLERTGQAR